MLFRSQGRILEQYESMIDEMGFHVIDATQSIEKQQKQMRRIVIRELGRGVPEGVLAAPVAAVTVRGAHHA